MKRHFALPVFLIVTALAFAACGGSDGSDEDRIVEAIKTSATTSDPSHCTELETLTFVEQGADAEGKEAVEECEEEAAGEGNDADSVDVTDVEVDGSNATAIVAFKGSSFDGQTLSVALVKDGDRWKLDRVTGFVKLDRAPLAKAFEERLAEQRGISEATVSCITEGVEEASQAEIEELFLGGSSEPFVELAEACS